MNSRPELKNYNVISTGTQKHLFTFAATDAKAAWKYLKSLGYSNVLVWLSNMPGDKC